MAAWAILHRTYRYGEGTPGISGAVVEVSGGLRERVVRLEERDSLALLHRPENPYRSGIRSKSRIRLSGAVMLPGRRRHGRTVRTRGKALASTITARPMAGSSPGSSRLPGAFSMIGAATRSDGRCRVRNRTPTTASGGPPPGIPGHTSPTPGSRALRKSAGQRATIEAPDTLYLLGLSYRTGGHGPSSSPGNFGRLRGVQRQRTTWNSRSCASCGKGLPEGVPRGPWRSPPTDRNWVNWERGGNFNPSGQIRIPSVFGDGTGVFATATRRLVRVLVERRPGLGSEPLCGPPEP